jgi:hypothetical protein
MKTAAEMTAWGRRENQPPVSLRAPRLWKSLRDSHILTALQSPPKEIQNQKQGGLRRGAILPLSGSFFD